MERRGGQEEVIVFPDQHFSSPSAESEEEVATVTNEPKTSSNGAVIAILILSVCIILIVGVIILYRKYKKSKRKADKTDCQISLPTLGTQYELHSLLSINTVGRKSSNHSEGSNPANNEDAEKSQDAFDGRVSRYIDASTVEMNNAEEYMAEHSKYTMKNILNVATEQTLGSSKSGNLLPPHADPENCTSRPMSMAETGSSNNDEMHQISILGGGDSVSRPVSKILEEYSDCSSSSQEISNNPTVQVFPTSPSYLKTRPKSENVENRPPILPAKKKLESASSEMAMNNFQQKLPSPASARSDSYLASIPPISQQSKPFLPPTQTINKSKEDVYRINKEILRKSSQDMNGQAVPTKQSLQITENVDIDYDFPASPGDDEDEEYDEPCSVLLEFDHHNQLDYDDPVQKYL